MPDVEQVREALEVYPEMHGFPRYEFVECGIVEEAARLWVVSQDAPRIWWCDARKSACNTVDCLVTPAVGEHANCGYRLLVSPAPTKET